MKPAARRGPVLELLDHLMSELRQLDLRCGEIERVLHDLAILLATTGGEDGALVEEPEACEP